MRPGLTLIVETSTPQASLALVWPDGRIEERSFTSDRSHNAALFAPLADLLAMEVERKVSLVLVGSGPGSYSGTRVGIAAAQGVAIASGCPAVALPSLLGVPSARAGAPCMAIGDARRGSYWWADLRQLHLRAAPELTDADGLAKKVTEAMAAGQPVFSFEDPARFPLAAELRDQVLLEFPSAADLWRAWCAADETTRQNWQALVPEPIYLKPPHITPGKRPQWLQA